MGDPLLKGLVRISEPAVNPVSLDEMKSYLRIDSADDDAVLSAMLSAATRTAEDYCKRAFITQKCRVSYDAKPFSVFSIPAVPNKIEIPRPPLKTVDSVKYYTDSDVEQTYSTANLNVDTDATPGRVFLKQDKEWPDDLRTFDALRIEFTCGYGAAGSDVPAPIRDAIKVIVATWYEHREELAEEPDSTRIPALSEKILSPYRVFRFA